MFKKVCTCVLPSKYPDGSSHCLFSYSQRTCRLHSLMSRMLLSSSKGPGMLPQQSSRCSEYQGDPRLDFTS